METLAVVLEMPHRLALKALDLVAPTADDVVVAVSWSGISTGTERLLWDGRMPAFPGLGYPLVPGYESVGRIVAAGANSGRQVGEFVFVPGSNGFKGARGLFGGAASCLVVRANRVIPIAERLGEQGVLLALAATAYHAIAAAPVSADGTRQLPELIVGHGVVGRLIARLTLALGGTPPTVWEKSKDRREGAAGYAVLDPSDDARSDYRAVYDASGDAGVLDMLIARLGRGGEVVLAGFYDERPSFAFPAAFMRELRLRVAAEWQPSDLATVADLVTAGRLSLDGLITNRAPANQAADAYQIAFGDPTCLKMILDWRAAA